MGGYLPEFGEHLSKFCLVKLNQVFRCFSGKFSGAF
jgi:hypothetical protein